MVEPELAIIGLLGISLILLIWHIINRNDSGEGIELRKEIREMGSEQMKTLAALGESPVSYTHLTLPTTPYV